jgi:hypothetical protein
LWWCVVSVSAAGLCSAPVLQPPLSAVGAALNSINWKHELRRLVLRCHSPAALAGSVAAPGCQGARVLLLVISRVSLRDSHLLIPCGWPAAPRKDLRLCNFRSCRTPPPIPLSYSGLPSQTENPPSPYCSSSTTVALPKLPHRRRCITLTSSNRFFFPAKAHSLRPLSTSSPPQPTFVPRRVCPREPGD